MNDFLQAHCKCPDCHSSSVRFEVESVRCMNCGADFPVLAGKPVLIRHDNEVFPPAAYVKPTPCSRGWWNRLASVVPSPSVNLSARRELRRFAQSLPSGNPANVLVIGTGRQRRKLESQLAGLIPIRLFSCDVDVRADVDLFCDGHELPFQDEVFDGIIITAVLQHVLCPDRVVQEIYRVLKTGGVVYSEVAFVQQVTEGAYDFTRYTLSGHRLLFRLFRDIRSGAVAGPGTVLVWAIENLLLCFAFNRYSRGLIKATVRVLFFWMKYIDYLVGNTAAAIDGASCTYFLGQKVEASKMTEDLIVRRYAGRKHLRHV